MFRAHPAKSIPFGWRGTHALGHPNMTLTQSHPCFRGNEEGKILETRIFRAVWKTILPPCSAPSGREGSCLFVKSGLPLVRGDGPAKSTGECELGNQAVAGCAGTGARVSHTSRRGALPLRASSLTRGRGEGRGRHAWVMRLALSGKD